MESIDLCRKIMGFLFNRSNWLILFWCNIIAIVFYWVAMEEVQDLLSRSLPIYYGLIIWKLVKVLIKVNNFLLNSICWLFLFWGFFELIFNKNFLGKAIREMLNSNLAFNIWLICVLAYIFIGNIITSISYILVFFFQDLTLLQTMYILDGEKFSLQHPVSYLTWPAVGIGIYIVFSTFSVKESTSS